MLHVMCEKQQTFSLKHILVKVFTTFMLDLCEFMLQLNAQRCLQLLFFLEQSMQLEKM